MVVLLFGTSAESLKKQILGFYLRPACKTNVLVTILLNNRLFSKRFTYEVTCSLCAARRCLYVHTKIEIPCGTLGYRNTCRMSNIWLPGMPKTHGRIRVAYERKDQD